MEDAATAQFVRIISRDPDQQKIAVFPQRRVEFISGFVVYGPLMQRLCGMIERIAPTDLTIIIEGERGTGKELIARAIHAKSKRTDRLQVVNCPALPETLAESELFGHEAGSFTGARGRRCGLLEEASGGTLFFDEIGDLPLALQGKLLRVLENRVFRRVGGNEAIPFRARVIAATNRDLVKLVESGQFRADLYDRLNVLSLDVPSLRERSEEIPILVHWFIERSRRPSLKISEQALNVLALYRWNGNVRELKNVIERAVTLVDGDVIGPEHLPPNLFLERKADAVGAPPTIPHNGEVRVHSMTLREVECAHIRLVYERYNRNKRLCAASLGISVKTLYNKLRACDVP